MSTKHWDYRFLWIKKIRREDRYTTLTKLKKFLEHPIERVGIPPAMYPKTENTPEQIDFAIEHGCFVEVDLWHVEGSLFLGHDKPETEVQINWLIQRKHKLILHYKNLGCASNPFLIDFNSFCHDQDSFTITQKGMGWTTQKELLNKDSIWVVNGKKESIEGIECLGICTDYPIFYDETCNNNPL